MKSLKESKNYQNVKQRHKVTKCCWKNGIYGLVQHRIATNLPFLKYTVICEVQQNKVGLYCSDYKPSPSKLARSTCASALLLLSFHLKKPDS